MWKELFIHHDSMAKSKSLNALGQVPSCLSRGRGPLSKGFSKLDVGELSEKNTKNVKPSQAKTHRKQPIE
ncbi:MAG: hypothetical protein ACK559_20630, partial [bacterium]